MGKPSLNGLSSESIFPLLKPFIESSLVVAFSGGVDSTVLLHLLVNLRHQGMLKTVKAVHVHHGLSDDADHWAEQCHAICQQWQVPLRIAKVSVPRNTGEGIEQAARHERYRIFQQALSGGGCLLMGHHQDDQAETVLLRLFRGTGIEGLRGIPQTRSLGKGQLLRPLLNISRGAIEEYASHHQLSWIEDGSNQDERFSRNFLRRSLIPQIERRWPGASQRIARLTGDAEAVCQSIESSVEEALAVCEHVEESWWADGFTLLNLKSLLDLESELQNQVCRLWLKKNIHIVPGRDLLKRVYVELINAREDAEPQLKLGEYLLRRFRGQLFITRENVPVPAESEQWCWQTDASVCLQDGLWVHSEATDNGGVTLPDRPLTIRRRQDVDTSLKFSVTRRSGRKTLKRWLQDYQLPPWCRDRQPFVFDDERMVAAPGLWVCSEYGSDSDSGWRLICRGT